MIYFLLGCMALVLSGLGLVAAGDPEGRSGRWVAISWGLALVCVVTDIVLIVRAFL